jgi:hypothetical protein
MGIFDSFRIRWPSQKQRAIDVVGRLRKLGAEHPHTQDSVKSLVELCEAVGESEKAEEWRAKPPQTEAGEQGHGASKVPPFSSAETYNRPTTRNPLICQF